MGERPKRMTEEALSTFVQDFVKEKIFCIQHVREVDNGLVGSIFMPLGLGALKYWSEDEVRNVGTVWEYTDNAQRLGINGYPMFRSCYCMHKADWELAVSAIERAKEALNKVQVGTGKTQGSL